MQSDAYSTHTWNFMRYQKTHERFHLQKLEDNWIIKENERQKHPDEEPISFIFWSKIFVFNMI